MNVDTGHLIKLLPDTKPPEGYLEVPKEMNNAVQKVLKGKQEANVSLTSGGKLSTWAAQQRKISRKQLKSKRKISLKSRQQNRKK